MSGNETLRVAIIIGSTRQDRFGPTPAAWFAERARRRSDLQVDLIDLREAGLPVVLGGDDPAAPAPEPVRALAPRIAGADAFVIVTPVYNHGYPASLKNAIDWYFEEWSAKPVGFVSYGGRGGGLHAVEQLRQVFAEVHATTIRNTVSFADHWDQFDEQGMPRDRVGADGAAASMLDQLIWWARALREARTKEPYKV
ncbi:MAG TPA: NAD(P)H-dependent oxidoreductase [Thermomonospora sp.]|nr:NAD(P)H-dependent oxidoreductase [Thermomonospora sp.]